MGAPSPSSSRPSSGGSLPTDSTSLLLLLAAVLVALLLGGVPAAVGYATSSSELRDALQVGGFLLATLPLTGAFVITTITMIATSRSERGNALSYIYAAAIGVFLAGLASVVTGLGGLSWNEFGNIAQVSNYGLLTPLFIALKAYGLYIEKYGLQTFLTGVAVGIISGLVLWKQWTKLRQRFVS